jgi:hypothetical protein
MRTNKKSLNIVIGIIFSLIASIFALVGCSGTSAPPTARGMYSNGNGYITVTENYIDFIRVQLSNEEILSFSGASFEYDIPDGQTKGTITAHKNGVTYKATFDTTKNTITFSGRTYTKGEGYSMPLDVSSVSSDDTTDETNES